MNRQKMQSRIEVVKEGSYEDGFREGMTWLPKVKDYGSAMIEVSPIDETNLKKVVVIYQRKELNNESH